MAHDWTDLSLSLSYSDYYATPHDLSPFTRG